MKKIFKLLFLFSLPLCLSGCLNNTNMEDIDIYTTVYPVEYVTDYLYGEHSNILSIYPDGINVNNFKLNDKQISDYSKASMYVFNGLGKEKDYVISMINNNDNLKIIDATSSMEYDYGIEELWLDPSNLLMISKNIDAGLLEYIDNGNKSQDKINEKYEELKIKLSELDAKIRLVAKASDNKTIIAGDKVFKYLEKYGFNVICLDDNEVSDKTIYDVKELITNGLNYIYVKDDSDLNDTVKYFQTNYDVKITKLHSLANLSEEQRKNKDDYFTLMNDNINLLKESLYN